MGETLPEIGTNRLSEIEPTFIPSLSSDLDVSHFDTRITEEGRVAENIDPLNSYEQVDNLLIQKFHKEFEGMSFVPK